ncbi:hypothetical protein ABZ759_26325 [Streptomyces sp. NPDC047860]|uniref:hypothetical protein n=1 Tax=Streptomyces sp. NPDC047860 TaxID=3155743 RepID=UPI00340F2826
MNPYMMLARFAADWVRLSRLLDPATQRELRKPLAELRTRRAGGECDENIAEQAVHTVLSALPTDEAARLRQDGTTARFTGAPQAAQYDGYSAVDLCMLVLDSNPMVGPVLGPVRDRLLRAPALTLTENAAHGRDTAHPAVDPRLIVLAGEYGEKHLPAFQFEAGNMPWAVVLEVNSVLGSGTDPWGAADWWLSPHSWWGAPPAELVGHGRDDELLTAAHALVGADEGW